MKKLFLLLVIFTISVDMSLGQDAADDFRSKLIFGLRVGANISNVYDAQADDMEADAKLGLATGAFLAIPIGTYIGIQPEILFSQKGYQGAGTSSTGNYTYSRTSNFIDVPLFFSFKPIKVLNILAGPQFSYLVRQTDSFRSSTLTVDEEREFRNQDVRRNILCFTGGVDLNLNHLVLGGRVGWDVQHNHGDGTYTDPRYKNVWYQATIGYRFY